jgi:hypothetical protein
MKPIKYIVTFLIATIAGVASTTFAQDSTKKKTIEITSSFKPVLREAVKIIFNATPPSIDSAKPKLTYTIPQKNLILNYQPAPIKPVALQSDSTSAWKYSNYIKVGVGNVHLPYVQAGLSFGDGASSYFNIFATHYTSKGTLPFQKNSATNVFAAGTMRTAANLEWNGKIGFNTNDYFLYGFTPATLNFSKEQLRQRLQTYEAKLSLRNMEPTAYGLTYNPNIKVSVFNGAQDKQKASEVNTLLHLPLNKSFGKSFAINIGLTADLTNYRPTGKTAVPNNLYYITPSLLLKTPNLYIQGGVIPSWDNKLFTLLPNIMADITTKDQRFTLQLGWIGYYEKGSYERFGGINSFITQPNVLLNTRIQERYGGFKGSVLNHISYSAKVGFVQYKNNPLFVNDTLDGKSFTTEYTSSMEALQLHGELAFTKGENFSWNTAITWNQFTKVKDQLKAFGLLPLEVSSTLRWQIFKEFYFKSELWFFDGAPYRVLSAPNTFDSRKGKAAVDVNAGLEFRITKNFNLWLQMNNLFNNPYQRWNQYEVFGFNVLGGVIYSFNNKR